jgi:sugar O-acyltransferase (sialic acid O-acetyltransferase NeuD family)
MEKNDLILVGGGGHCKSLIDAAESSGYNIIGILDTSENVGKSVCGINIIGTDDDMILYVNKALFVISVGCVKDSSLRLQLYNKVKQSGGRFATVVASTAYVSKHAFIGEGSVVLHQSFVNADAKIGDNCIINTFANIEHDVRIGNHTHISTGVMVNGGCVIGQSVFIGSQSVIKQGIHISDNITVGASSYVNNSIYEKGIYIGIPVHKIK